ncbi:MAG: SEC-C metal-binding domain-containing protein [Caldilineaceae bacterium]
MPKRDKWYDYMDEDERRRSLARIERVEAARKQSRPAPSPSTKVGRNDPCPCGSGKKYKHCHGKAGV